MKYIRTKDGRIVKVPNNAGIILYDNEKLLIDTKQKDQTCVYGIVEKQADTIEELCDEFVIENKKDHLHINYANDVRQAIKMVIGNINKEEWFIYGAIWTEWGLKYVAKMNDKGELELL